MPGARALLLALARYVGARSVAIEVTPRCNQSCLFCYNVWKAGATETGELDSATLAQVVERVTQSYRPHVITITGGEPLLRPDLIEVVRCASRRARCNLLTNGTLLDKTLCADLLAAGVSTFQIPLLGADAETHDALVGRASFAGVVEAIATLRQVGATVVTTFVATRRNLHAWRETVELNVALGTSGIQLNRFNVGGAGIALAAELQPEIADLVAALSIADESVARYGIEVSCGVPIPPCVVDRARFPRVYFTDCPVGTRNAYPTIDAQGNVRPCTHSSTVVGNVLRDDLSDALRSGRAVEYAAFVPSECVGCQAVRSCRGGCRAAGEAVAGRLALDPFVRGGAEGGLGPCGTCLSS